MYLLLSYVLHWIFYGGFVCFGLLLNSLVFILLALIWDGLLSFCGPILLLWSCDFLFLGLFSRL